MSTNAERLHQSRLDAGQLRAERFEREVAAWRPRRRCPECGRIFDLGDEIDAEEWAYGHDCEAS